MIKNEKLISDFGYFMAQKLAKQLLEKSMITLSQFNKLCKLNLKSFSPMYADLFPKTVD